ncbi:MAG: DUF58 domain-containing protein [Blastocatellia bacterium]
MPSCPTRAMLKSLRHKQSVRSLLVLGLLTALAAVSVFVANVADRNGNPDLGSISAKMAVGLTVVIVLYVVSKLAQSISIYSDISLNFTNSGLVFGALILLVAILALSSGNNLLYLVLSVLAATLFVSFIGSRLSLSRVRIGVRYPDHIFAGEPVPFDVTVANQKRLLPAFSIGVAASEQQGEAHSADAENALLAHLAYLPIVPARTEARSRIERRFARRGVYPIRGFVVGTRFPLGFVEQRRFVESASEIVVYPAPLALDELAPLIRQTQGRIESRLKGSGSDLYAIRPYLASDHHHHIDWKATAKTASLMVREFTRDDDLRVTIAFETCVPAELAGHESFDARFERAVAAAAGLCRFFIEQGGEVRLLAGADDSGYGAGRQHLFTMLRRLAAVAPVANLPEERHQEPWRDNQFRIVITPSHRDSVSPGTHVISYEEFVVPPSGGMTQKSSSSA